MLPFPKAGDIFSERYELIEILGSGGIGTVFRARQLDSQRTVALKILKSNPAVDDEFRARFLRESRAMAKLDHKGVVRVYHAGITEHGLAYIAMELLDGQSLRQLMNETENENGLPARKAIHLAKEVADTLAYVHEHGIIHRDLKPENLIVCDPQQSSVKVLDFGLARIEQEQKLTGTGVLLGTAAYMSPEQCMGRIASEASDIYSLCICLYEMLTGKKPFDADNPVGLMYKQMHESVPLIQKTETDCFHPLMNEILAEGLCKDPEKRFKSMNELSAELARLETSLSDAKAGKSKLFLSVTSVAIAIAALSFWILSYSKQLLLSKSGKADGQKLETEPELGHMRITPSEAMLVIKKANSFEDQGEPEKSREILEKYMRSKRLDRKAKCLLLVRRGKIASGKDAVDYARQACNTAKEDYELDGSDSSKALYLSSAANLAEELLVQKQYAEAFRLGREMAIISTKGEGGVSRPVFLTILRVVTISDFLAIQAEAALRMGEKARAAKLLDDLEKYDYGGSRVPLRIAELMLELHSYRHLENYIYGLGSAYEHDDGGMLYEYDAYMSYEALMQVEASCLQHNLKRYAELALNGAEKIVKFTEVRTVSFRPALDFRIEKSRFLIAFGNKKAGLRALKQLVSDWIEANTPGAEKYGYLTGLNPMPLMLVLLQEQLHEDAARLSKLILLQYVGNFSKLNPEYDDQDRGYTKTIESLNPYKNLDFVKEFVARLTAAQKEERNFRDQRMQQVVGRVVKDSSP